jgi:hypothetical protein
MSLGLNQSLSSSGGNKLLPAIDSNLKSWCTAPTSDGKTLSNIQGTSVNLKNVNCLDFDSSGDRVEIDSAGGVDLTTDATNNFGSCVITATFMQESAGLQVIHSCGSTSYRLWTQNGYLKLNGIAVEIFPIEQNKVYRSTVTFNESGQATNFVLENLTDGTTQTNSAVRNAGGHGGANGFQIGARNDGLNWNGKISNVSVTNSSVGANLHLPLAEGSGSVAYDVSGNGANGAIVGATHSTLDGIESWNHEYGFSVDGSVKVPALNTKTTQVATFDGVADVVVTEPVTLGNDFEFEWTGSITNSENFGAIFANKTSATSEGNFSINRFLFFDRIVIDHFPNGGVLTQPVINVSFFDGLVHTHKVTVNNNTITYLVDGVSIYSNTGSVGSGFTDSESIGIYGRPDGAVNVGGALHNFKLTISGSTAFEYNFQNDIGTTTVQDLSTNDNDGTVTVGAGGLDSFWGIRVADTAGSLVSADYATGNLTISNPAGFVHNGSECGFETGLQELTSTEIFAINNSTATQLFIRKNNGNVTQFFEYEANLTGTDLTRTRAYVG